MIRPPRVERQADGCPLLVDSFGCGHTPRALIATIYYLTEQAALARAQGWSDLATELAAHIQQRRTWVRWMESGVEY